MDKFNYLGVMISTGGGMQRKWLLGYFREKVCVGRGVIEKLWKENMLSREVKQDMFSLRRRDSRVI